MNQSPTGSSPPINKNNPVNLQGQFTGDACVECAIKCQDAACSASEMTSQCTDQCVIVACNDPTHDQMNCHDSRHCNTTCEGDRDCPDCYSAGFEEFLQCCTDYHAYFSDAPQAVDSPFAWGPPLDAMACDCDGLMQDGHRDFSAFNPQNTTDPNILSSGSSVASGSPGFPPSLTVSTSNTLASPADNLSPSVTTNQPPQILSCMWGNCNASFYSLSDLVGHVNLQHLRSSSLLSTSKQEIQQYHQDTVNNSILSCPWGDCNVYPSPNSILGPSEGVPFDTALNTLASHLFHDHLGVPTDTSFEHAPVNSVPVTFDTTSTGVPLTESLNAAVHACSGTHACRWKSCTRTFASCDELTAHLISVHVGAGKAHYECFWGECRRNGAQGFSSKQKISRHLQSHTGHRPFTCTVCNQNFSEAATLQQHMRRHTQEKPYLCDFPGCNKAFAITGALTIHKRTHNGEKPFKCTYCDRAFSESSNLSKHLRTHTGDRPYLCSEVGCGKAFARPDQLTRHMSVHRRKDILVVQ